MATFDSTYFVDDLNDIKQVDEHTGTTMSHKNFLKVPLRPILSGPAVFVKKPTNSTNYGLNIHRSNKAKEGTSSS